MIPSRFALVLVGALGLLLVIGFVEPALAVAGLVADLVVVALVLVDGRLAGRRALTIERETPRTMHQGERTEIAYELVHPGEATLRVRLRDVLGPELTLAPVDAERTLPPRSRVRVTHELVPRLRGDARLAPVAVRVRGPLGLAWAPREVCEGEEVRVLPKAHLEGEAGLLVRQALERRLGVSPRAMRGLSQELYGVREYLPGDEYRLIHWKAAAKRHRPVTRETTWEQHQEIVILVDAGRPMASLAGGMSKLDHTFAAVLALMRVIASQQDSATLIVFSKEIRRVLRVDRRTRSFSTIFESVYDEQADLDEPEYEVAAAWCARRVPRRSLAILCTSVIDLGGADLLARAAAALGARHNTLLVDLEDPGLIELAQSVPDEPLGAFAKASAMGLRAANRELGSRLRAQGVELLSVPASRLAIGVLQGYLDFKARARRAG